MFVSKHTKKLVLLTLFDVLKVFCLRYGFNWRFVRFYIAIFVYTEKLLTSVTCTKENMGQFLCPFGPQDFKNVFKKSSHCAFCEKIHIKEYTGAITDIYIYIMYRKYDKNENRTPNVDLNEIRVRKILNFSEFP